MQHRNVLPFLGVVNLRGEVYLVSPWMDYGDVATFTVDREAYLRRSKSDVERLNHPRKDVYETFSEQDTVSTDVSPSTLRP